MQLRTRVWLDDKRRELKRCFHLYGPEVAAWDLPMFIQIIDSQAREIRMLRTKLGVKSK